MDHLEISPGSGDPSKSRDVVKVNQGTFVLKERWTGPKANQSDYNKNSGGFGTSRSRNGNHNLKIELNPDESEIPRQNIDSRLKKLMSGDLESIPVFMLDYRTEWLDSDKKKRHRHEKKLNKSSMEEKFIDKSKERKIKSEISNEQVSHVEKLLKNINMSSEPLKTKKKFKSAGIKDNLLEEQLTMDYDLNSNKRDPYDSFENPIDKKATKEDIKVDFTVGDQLIDDVDVDFIVRQYPLQKVWDGSIKPSGLSKKLKLGNQKDTKHVVAEKDTKRVLAAKETKCVLAGKDTKHALVEKDTKCVLAAKDSKHVLAEKDTKHVLVEKDTKHVLVEKDTKHILVEKNTEHVLVEKDTKHVLDEKDTKHVLVEKDTKHVLVEKDRKHETDSKHVLEDSNPDQKGIANTAKIETLVEETTTSNESIEPQPKHQIEKVKARKRTYAEMIGWIEDKMKETARRTIKRKLEEQAMKGAMEAFEKWWEEQENQQNLSLKDEQKDILGVGGYESDETGPD